MKESKYIKIKVKKWNMSQLFDDNAKVLPFTNLKLKETGDASHFDEMAEKSKILLVGTSKGKGFAGVMKRWNFSGGPNSHGQKDTHRSPGSIGTQGQGRVIPGKKMAGRLGGDTISITTKFLGFDKAEGTIRVKGAVPGGKNSEVFVFLPKKS